MMKMSDPKDYADQNEPPIDCDDDLNYNGHYEDDFGPYDYGNEEDYERQMGY